MIQLHHNLILQIYKNHILKLFLRVKVCLVNATVKFANCKSEIINNKVKITLNQHTSSDF